MLASHSDVEISLGVPDNTVLFTAVIKLDKVFVILAVRTVLISSLLGLVAGLSYVYRNTKEVLKAVRTEHTKRLQYELTSQGNILSFRLVRYSKQLAT